MFSSQSENQETLLWAKFKHKVLKAWKKNLSTAVKIAQLKRKPANGI